MIEEMVADIGSGHNIVATVYVDCRSMYRAHGPEAFRPVGEVEFANGVAAMAASGGYGKAAICAGIVSHVNLLLGDGAKAVLEAEIVAGNGRFPGIPPRGMPIPMWPACMRHAQRAYCSTARFERVLPASRRWA
jgi:hypothetical protein